MVEIRIYVEGGGKGTPAIRLREGFDSFLKQFKNAARERNSDVRVIPCGPRDSAYHDFCLALKSRPDSFNILLVDSESPVEKLPWQHLGWDSKGCDDSHCHLMVQIMEAWFLADKEALIQFYGQRFQASALPKAKNVEQTAKSKVETALKLATRNTQKGEYHKTHHAPKILGQLDPDKVCQAAPHCKLLFKTLAEKLDVAI